MPEIKVKFDRHGLGDCVHFAHLLQMYRRRGYEITIQGEDNKRLVWQAAGCTISAHRGLVDHNWGYPAQFENLDQPDHLGNKAAHNIGHAPMPPIDGDRAALWDELCAVRLSVNDLIGQEARDAATAFLDGLPRPIVCFHASGTNWRERKSIPPAISFQVIMELLRVTGGSVVSLDWDHRDPIVAHPRCKPIWPSWGKIDLERLGALYSLSDLMIGIDSGPFHFAAMTDVPALGVFRSLQPVRCCLPSPRADYLVSGKYEKNWQSRRDRWNLRQYSGDQASVADILAVATSILTGSPRQWRVETPKVDLKPYAGHYIYQRVGHDTRTVLLADTGLIAEGAGACERRWGVRMDGDTPVIDIAGDEGVICSCRQDGHQFAGRWTKFERMPILLVRIDRPADAASPDPEHSPIPQAYYLDAIGESECQIDLLENGSVRGTNMVDSWSSEDGYLRLSSGQKTVCSLRLESDQCYRGTITIDEHDVAAEMIAATRQPYRSIGPTEPVEHQPRRYRYVTAAQFAHDCFAFARRLPPVRAVAGVPRSGLLAASLIAAELNCPMMPLESWFGPHVGLCNVPRRGRGVRYPADGMLLVVDDSCSSGRVIARLRQQLHPDVKIAVIDGNAAADFVFRQADPTIYTSYEWTLLHDANAEFTLCDLDGVLCEDWKGGFEGDHPDAYAAFLENVNPLRLPSYPVLGIVTNRIEKYRPETERWLLRHGVVYQHLIMAPFQDAHERDRAGLASERKADAYEQFPEARLFIESSPGQSEVIFRRTGRPVLCYDNNKLHSK